MPPSQFLQLFPNLVHVAKDASTGAVDKQKKKQRSDCHLCCRLSDRREGEMRE
jgi:hypothetical protein